jgi:hypothetical protein
MSHSFDAQLIRFVPYIPKGPPKRNSIKRRSNKKTMPVEKKRITLSEEPSTSPIIPAHLDAGNDGDLSKYFDSRRSCILCSLTDYRGPRYLQNRAT